MENLVPLGTGNSRLMKSNIPASTTLAQLIQMLNKGTFPYDIGPLNPAGISQQGTPLNKATLFSDQTMAKYPSGIEDPDGALDWLKDNAGAAIGTYPAAMDITAGDVCDVVDGKATTLYEETDIVAQQCETPVSYSGDISAIGDGMFSFSLRSTSSAAYMHVYRQDETGISKVASTSSANLYNYLGSASDGDKTIFSLARPTYGSLTLYSHKLSGSSLNISGSTVGIWTDTISAVEPRKMGVCYLGNNKVAVLAFSDSFTSPASAPTLYLIDMTLSITGSGTNSLISATTISSNVAVSNSSLFHLVKLSDYNGGNRLFCVYHQATVSPYSCFGRVVSISENNEITLGPESTVFPSSFIPTGACSVGDNIVGVTGYYQKFYGFLKLTVNGLDFSLSEYKETEYKPTGCASLTNSIAAVFLSNGAANTIQAFDMTDMTVLDSVGQLSGISSGTVLFVSSDSLNGRVYAASIPDSSNAMTSYLYTFEYKNNKLLQYVVSIADTAIALNSASPGEDVRLLFGGSATLPGATAGTEIVSDGIIGEVPIDGMVTALSKGIRNNLTQIYTGSYTGTGQYGSSNPNTLTFPFEPKLVVVGFGLDGWLIFITTGTENSDAFFANAYYSNKYTISGNELKWYTHDTNPAYQLNVSGATYHFIAIG